MDWRLVEKGRDERGKRGGYANILFIYENFHKQT